ncbi:glycosyltransferase family 4 protein [uncultured Aquimarina sp.]|uniref:glycosyltransferase family 4 protein n=1 Tax=uncultured Aquimarina sp. TaxID=575652 RepID=UPI002610FA72|nr:glycosyltransferase family 4 protein [uncultured Aquimarina sp.]
MNRKISVCHLTSPHPRYDTRIFHKECISLAKIGYDITLVVADGNKNEKLEGVNIVGIEKPKNKLERLYKTTKKIYQKAIELNADIYHFHDPELIYVGLKLIKKGKKVIYDIHEDLPRQLFVQKNKLIKRKIMEFFLERFENYGAKRFTALFTSTPYIKNRFIKINTNTENINNFPILNELLSKDEVRKNGNEICYVGSIVKIRGIFEMVRAIDSLDVKLNVCGDFASEDLKEEVSSLTSWEKVNYLGFVGRDKVREVMNESVAGLVTLLPHPNFIKSYPVKMFEYMAASLPVIASDFPLFKEIIEGNDCGICVNASNPDEIANAIKYIMDNPEEAKKMGENGRRAVIEKYNWEKEVEKLSKVYANIIKDE